MGNNLDNYCNNLWPLIYDQFNKKRLIQSKEHELYSTEMASCSGPILEVACGTGMIFLPLLKKGLDIYGFDVSEQMLKRLFAIAKSEGLTNVHNRVSLQNMINFKYEKKFEYIFIPNRSFLHLLNMDDQLACLQNIHNHLADGGMLILNFSTPNLPVLLSQLGSDSEFKIFGEYPHPDGTGDIKVCVRQINDMDEQIQKLTWRFEFAGQTYETPMSTRWIYRNEFEILARFAGFKIAQLSTFEKSQYKGKGEMIWILKK